MVRGSDKSHLGSTRLGAARKEHWGCIVVEMFRRRGTETHWHPDYRNIMVIVHTSIGLSVFDGTRNLL